MNAEVERMVSVLLTLVNDTELSRYWTPADEQELRSRCEAEGMYFLTTVLPRLGKELGKLLATGTMSPVEGFKSRRGHAYPQFMRKAWEVIILDSWLDANDNKVSRSVRALRGDNFLHLEFSHELAGAVKAIRQVSLMYYKTKLPYSADQVKGVEAAFIAAEADLADLDLSEGSDYCVNTNAYEGVGFISSIPDRSVDSLLTRASRLVKRLLAGTNPRDIRPRHGSGASACKTNPWERYKLPRFIPKLDAVYPYSDWFYLSYGVDCLSHESIDALEVVEEPQARVVYVPKDSRGPRLISAEPREYMYIQQGLMTLLYDTISAYPMVKAQLDCRDQTRNQRLARWGSASGAVVTLDLKEASDRVSMTLVERLFPRDWVECLKACRSTSTRLPSGKVVNFHKFAPMGSAVCFPIEAICFWAIAHAAINSKEFLLKDLFSATPFGLEANNLAVFGDDIIVPTEHSNAVVSALSSVALIVNLDKSYLNGPFRESCGKEYLLGEDVSIVRCGHVPAVQGSRAMMDHARFRTADWFNNLIIRYGTYALTDPLYHLFHEWYGEIVISPRVILANDDFQQDTVPSRGLILLGADRYVPPSVPPKGRSKTTSKKVSCFSKRMHPDLQRLEVYVLTEQPVVQKLDIDDWSHLLRILLCGSGREDASMWTLAKRCRYKYGWVAV